MANITENTINEIIKSHIFGMTNAEIAEVYKISEEDVKMLLCERHDDVEAERAYRSLLKKGV